jgi:hypothetical protein
MTPSLAVGIAEGYESAESEEQVIEAWQYLVDSGLAWRLQGWFGRTATDMIDQGLIKYHPPTKVVPDYNKPLFDTIGEARW